VKNKIKELRKQMGLTQEDLADKVKVSRQTIISLEKGRYDPSIFLAYKIARSFTRTIEEVFIFEEEED
jgi:putative transcriptional regulator